MSGLSAETVARVRASWGLVTRTPLHVTSHFYDHLFGAHPELRPLFRHTDMAAQEEKLLQTLAVVVAGLDDLGRLVPAVEALGRRHAGYGVHDAHYAAVGDALLAALADLLGDAFEPAIHDAWAQAYGVLADVMRRAVDASAPIPA